MCNKTRLPLRFIIRLIVCCAAVSTMTGCEKSEMKQTGFLSDYSKLQQQSSNSFRYVKPGNPMAGYSKFIIDPVVITTEAQGKLSDEDLRDITSYMHDAIVNALADKYEVVHHPGPGTARVRLALTEIKKSKTIQNTLPITKMAGTGLGGAALEAEILDSITREQLGAVLESQIGNRFSLDGYSTWGDAKAIMDGWAKRFRIRLDEAHGN